MTAGPRFSVVLACVDTFPTIARTVECIRAQTLHDQIELVIVATSREQLDAPASLASGLFDVRVVEAGEIRSVAAANAVGVRHARSPIVAFAEDHCFPEPDWAAALLGAHVGPWAAVGPVLRNANPETLVSCADFLVAYAPWAAPCRSGEREFLPGHNSSYKREVLLAYGDNLEEMLDAETALHFDLRASGRRLYLESNARAAHANIALARSWVPLQYLNGRLFGGARARGWSGPRKLAFAAGSPLIPLLRLARILRDVRRMGLPAGRVVRALPLLAVGLVLDALGQMVGYLRGRGGSEQQIRQYEFRRIDHVPERERVLLAAPRDGAGPGH